MTQWLVDVLRLPQTFLVENRLETSEKSVAKSVKNRETVLGRDGVRIN